MVQAKCTLAASRRKLKQAKILSLRHRPRFSGRRFFFNKDISFSEGGKVRRLGIAYHSGMLRDAREEQLFRTCACGTELAMTGMPEAFL
jgi:hypothetical protein